MTDRQEKPKYDYAAQCVAIIKKLSAPEPFVMPTGAEVQPIIGDIVTEALLKQLPLPLIDGRRP